VSTRKLATRMKVDHTTILRHLSEIGKVKKMDKWVPHELSERNKLDRLNVCSSLLTRFHREPFFDRIITYDEKWVLYDNRKSPILLHDNARPHTSYKTIAKLNELKYEILQHPAYSSDLSPTDFHFFKHLEQFLRALLSDLKT
ncbi:SETMR methyltransferase, partial [Acromyrmex insinuator]